MSKKTQDPDKHLKYAITLSAKIGELFDEESESDFHLQLKEIRKEENLTDFIHALVSIMPFSIYQKLTGDTEMDILAFNHMANRLILQYQRDKK